MKINIILTILVLALIAVIVLTSCGTPRHPVYHYHSGSTHVISDEPIGPYHIGDPSTHSQHVFVEEFSDEEEDDPYTYEPSTEKKECQHEFGCNQPYCLVLHYCKKCDKASWPPECDHIFVYEGIERTAELPKTYTPEWSCVCIKCFKQSTCY